MAPFKKHVDWEAAMPRLIAMVENGTPTTIIAKEFNVTRGTINKVLRDTKIEFKDRRPRGYGGKFDWKSFDPRIRQMLESGLSRTEIAEQIGTSCTMITERCKLMGINLTKLRRKRMQDTAEVDPVKPSKSAYLTFREIKKVDQLVLKGWDALYAIEEVRANPPIPLFKE